MRKPLASFLLFVAACSTDKHTITPSATNVVPLQAVLLTDQNAMFAVPSYPATIGDSAVTVYRASATQLGVLVPQDASGTLVLRLGKVDSTTYDDVTLTVGAAPQVSDPSTSVHATISAATTSAQMNATTYSARKDLAPLFTAAMQNLTRLGTSFDALSTADQLTAAQLIAANATQTAQSSQSSFTAFSPVALQHGTDVSGDFVIASSIAVASGALGVGYGIRAVSDLVAELADYGTVTSQTFIQSSGIIIRDSATGLTELHFVSNKPLTFPLSLVMSNLSSADASAPTPVTQPFVDLYADLGMQWPALTQPLSPALGSAPQLADVAPLSMNEPLPAGDISLGPTMGTVTIDNSTFANGSCTLTVTSTACTSASSPDVPFAITLEYGDAAGNLVQLPLGASLSCG